MKNGDLLLIGAAIVGGYFLAPKAVKDKVNDALGSGGINIDLPSINLPNITLPAFNNPGIPAIPDIPKWFGATMDDLNKFLSGTNGNGNSNSGKNAFDSGVDSLIKLEDATTRNLKENGQNLGNGFFAASDYLAGGWYTHSPTGQQTIELSGKLGGWLGSLFAPDILNRDATDKAFAKVGLTTNDVQRMGHPAFVAYMQAHDQAARSEGARAQADLAKAAPSNVDCPITPAKPDMTIIDYRNSGGTGYRDMGD